jgi:hypothetical protein
MNVELLRKVEAHILEEPKRLYMRTWVKHKDQDGVLRIRGQEGRQRDYPACGTAGCIAGWAVMLSYAESKTPITTVDGDDLGEEARLLLGLGIFEAHRLFVPLNWPLEFRQGISDDGEPETAKVAVRRIEHFIETEGRE